MKFKKYTIITVTLSLMMTGCNKNNTNNLKIPKQTTSSSIESSVKTVKVESTNNIFLESSNINEVKNIIESSNITTTQKIDVSQIPINFAITYLNGNNNHQVAVFLDTEQEYSKYIINNVSEIKNSNIYVFLITGDNEYIDKIYCSENKNNSLYLYLNNKQINQSNRNCDKDGLNFYQTYFKNNYNITELPIIIFGDGNIVKNAINATPNLINEYNKES